MTPSNYERCIQRLEIIAQQMERGEVPVDQLALRLREAQNLIRHCRQLLTAADEAVQQILNPEVNPEDSSAEDFKEKLG